MSLAVDQGRISGDDPQTSVATATGPQRRAQRNFQAAIHRLQDVLPKDSCARLGKYKFPTLDASASVESGCEELETAMENFIDSMDQKAKDQAKSRSQRIKGMVKRWFCASYPFAELLMTVAKEASSVNIPFLNPYGMVFASLLILSKTAYEEANRGDDILSTVELLATTINRIKLVKQLPSGMPDVFQLANVRTAALDLCATIVNYLAIGIQSLKSSFNSNLSNSYTSSCSELIHELENVLRNVFAKDDILSAAIEQVDRATQTYNASLSDMMLTIVMDGRADGKDIQATVLRTFSSLHELHQKVDRIPTYHIVDLVSDNTLSEIRYSSLRQEINGLALIFRMAHGADVRGMAIRSGLEIRVTRQEVLDWIFPDDFGAKHRAVKAKRVANSGSWFLNHPDFQSWAYDKSSNMLFCPGLAGAGKSVITSLVIDELEARYGNQSVGIAYVYFDYKNQEKESMPSIFASLLKQLVVRKDEMTPELLTYYGRFRSRATQPELPVILQTILHLTTLFNSTYFILDALDELDEKHLPSLLNSLSQLLDGGQTIQIFATSRPHLGAVQTFFKSALSISIFADHEDIKNYLTIKVDEKLSESQRALKSKIVDSLSISADGMYSSLLRRQFLLPNRFLLGEAQLNYVFSFTNPRNMRHALNTSVPSELFDIYEIVMAGIRRSHGDKQQIAQGVLSWIFWARRPLQMSELREAIAIQEEDVDLGEEDLTQVDDIVQACGSLIVLSPETGDVAFSHEMVQQFLEERCKDYLLPESDIAKSCLTYLLFDTFNEGPAGDEETFKARQKTRPFAQYASCYWGPHVKGAAAEDDPEILQMVLRLGTSTERLESIAQFCLEGIGIGWQDFGPRCHGKALIHMFAEDGLITMAKNVFESPAINAEIPSQTIDKSYATAKTEDGRCPLHYAAGNGHIPMIRFLLDANVDVSAQDISGVTALHVACRYGKGEAVDCLIEAGAEVNTVDNYGSTPLLVASHVGHSDIVKSLLKAKANPMSQDLYGRTALHSAAMSGHDTVVKLLLDAVAGIETWDDLRTPAAHSVSENPKIEAVPASKAIIAFVDMKNNETATALHLAAVSGHASVIRELLAAKADVNAVTDLGCTALHMASGENHVSSLSLLLEHNANAMARAYDEGWTALHFAARYGSREVINLILNAMVETNALSKEEQTLPNLDRREDDVKVANLSIEKNPNARGDDDKQKRRGSVDEVDDGMMTRRPSQETGVDTPTSSGVTALHLAARGGHSEMVKILLEARADVNIEDKAKWTALHYAAFNGHTEIVEILLAAQSDPGATIQTPCLYTPLHLAANAGHTSTIDKLLATNGNLMYARDYLGQTALHVATTEGRINAVERLLSWMTDKDIVSIEDNYGLTALHGAVKAKRFGIARILSTHIQVNRLPKSSNDLQNVLGPATVDGTSSIDEDSEIDMDVCLEMAKLYPDKPRTYGELGRIYIAQQNYAPAISSYETALDLLIKIVDFRGIEELTHGGVFCDGCEGRPDIVGYRHKCVSCSDFDLCHKCFQSSPRPHAEHEFITIPSEEWLQRRLTAAKQS